ncbi:glycosyltransferase family 4 protein [Microaerobacter geothermalis]|uniref:glycosyltransferase family 4 protein n=1 Tax=Microaerobacter geothermalis TaxID=674972 RepID=UPI001F197584|nr:glycosyltransferase family 4 protein [Microaerobacter geothermalis]MCF6093328.1 glycosyltransferase family 4 protein [Microaerobacter geothermalis]
MTRSILMITSEFEPDIVGGLGIVSTQLVKELVKKGIQVTVVSLRRSGDYVSSHEGKFKVIRFPKITRFYQNRQMIPESISPYLKKISPDLIHIQCVQGMELGKNLKSHYRVPLIYTSHSIGREEAEGRINPDQLLVVKQQEKLYETADSIVCPSNMEKRVLLKHYPLWESKVTVIPNGIAEIDIPRRKNANLYHLLYVGRLAWSKGLETVIRALPLVVRKHPRTVLHVVGDGSSSYRRHIQGLIKKYHLDKRVVFHSWMEQRKLSNVYSLSGIVIVPSYYESFGMVVLEAMAHGVPVIVTTAVGVAEDMSRSVVMKIKPKNVQEMAEAIHHLLSNQSSAKSRGKAGLKLVKKYFWSNTADQYLALYRKLTNK